MERLRERHDGARRRTPRAGRGCVTNERGDAARSGALLRRNQRGCNTKWSHAPPTGGASAKQRTDPPTHGRRRAAPPRPAFVLHRGRIPSAPARPRKVRTDTSAGACSKPTMTGRTNQTGIGPVRSIQAINGLKMTWSRTRASCHRTRRPGEDKDTVKRRDQTGGERNRWATRRSRSWWSGAMAAMARCSQPPSATRRHCPRSSSRR